MTNYTTKLKIELLRNQMKQSDLAKVVGITLASFNNKLNGNQEFKLSEAVKIAKTLNTNLNDLFFE